LGRYLFTEVRRLKPYYQHAFGEGLSDEELDQSTGSIKLLQSQVYELVRDGHRNGLRPAARAKLMKDIFHVAFTQELKHLVLNQFLGLQQLL